MQMGFRVTNTVFFLQLIHAYDSHTQRIEYFSALLHSAYRSRVCHFQNNTYSNFTATCDIVDNFL